MLFFFLCFCTLHFFQAYVNNKEGTKKKLIRDVYKKGDVGFRSGDIMTVDKYGWVYFRVRSAFV